MDLTHLTLSSKPALKATYNDQMGMPLEEIVYGFSVSLSLHSKRQQALRLPAQQYACLKYPPIALNLLGDGMGTDIVEGFSQCMYPHLQSVQGCSQEQT